MKTTSILVLAISSWTLTFAQLKVFQENVISTGEYETHPCFSPSGDTLYFLKGLPDASFFAIYFTVKKGNTWTKPNVVPFSGRYSDADPFVTKDGKTLYFVSARPIHPGDSAKQDWDIWKVAITKKGWGEPVHLGDVINSGGSEFFPTLADNGNLYFGSERVGGKGRSDIYVSKPNGAAFGAPENLGDSVNTVNNEYEPHIAPDESYIIFMATIPNALRFADFYITRKKVDGTWTKAKKLSAPINSPATEWGGRVTRDGKYFFFGSSRNNTTGSEIIGNGKPADFERVLRSAGNGLGDIYFVEMALVK